MQPSPSNLFDLPSRIEGRALSRSLGLGLAHYRSCRLCRLPWHCCMVSTQALKPSNMRDQNLWSKWAILDAMRQKLLCNIVHFFWIAHSLGCYQSLAVFWAVSWVVKSGCDLVIIIIHSITQLTRWLINRSFGFISNLPEFYFDTIYKLLLNSH